MPIASPRYQFKHETVVGAPDDPGVYALYLDEELIFFGHAVGAATIQTRLIAHFFKLVDPSHATHYGWEICRDPLKRMAELVREYERNFWRLPRYNPRGTSSSA
jgi:hypothetical protein